MITRRLHAVSEVLRLGPKRQDEPRVLEQYAETAGWPKRPIGDWGRQPMLQMSARRFEVASLGGGRRV
jgi:hypothetical protein